MQSCSVAGDVLRDINHDDLTPTAAAPLPVKGAGPLICPTAGEGSVHHL